jgi:pyruvate,water dikinase
MLRNFFNRLFRFIKEPLKYRRSVSNASNSWIKEKYHFFKEALNYNNDILRLINDIEVKLTGEELFGFDFIKNLVEKIALSTFQLIKSVNHISEGEYHSLYNTLENINNKIQKELTFGTATSVDDLVIPYNKITRDLLDAVGGKNATLGEIRNKLGLSVPDGFAITTRAYELFIEKNNLRKNIYKVLNLIDLKEQESIERASKDIQSMILNSDLPQELIISINSAYDKLEQSVGKPIKVAIRSSSISEDSIFSFAGQYESMLNVKKEEIPDAYKCVVASLYSPSAIFYLAHKGLAGIEQKMCVGCMVMIDAKTAGIVYTKDPNNPEGNILLINAVMGLGKSAVDGTATPDAYFVDRDKLTIVKKRIASKNSMLVLNDVSGIDKLVFEKVNNEPCLTDRQVHLLADKALQIERYFNSPQDIEWCIDRNDELFILQSRQLRFFNAVIKERKKYNGYKILLDSGEIVYPGIGIGKAFVLKDEKDISHVPSGAILVTFHPSPSLVRVMDRVNAIITDTGGVTGHMASIAREFNIPTITDTRIATSTIKQDEIITVDATSGYVYSGVISELKQVHTRKPSIMKDTPVFNKLKNISRYIIPLNLTDPSNERFKPEFCETIHDITRFCHEKAIHHMFKIGEKIGENTYLLKMGVRLPVDLYILDIGEGIKYEPKNGIIKIEDIASVPFYAFMKGFTHPDIRWWEPRRIDIKGFLSVISSAATRIRTYEKPIGDRSYAIISKDYLNFNSRVGYHFNTIDAYCDDIKDNNYITFYFQGGASEDIRRFRRAKFINDVLIAFNFVTESKGDRVMAYLRKYDKEVIKDKLDMLGRLMLCALHLDMLMTSDSSVEWFVKAFLEGNYNFEL